MRKRLIKIGPHNKGRYPLFPHETVKIVIYMSEKKIILLS